MKILITNDDGVFAPGLLALYEALSSIAEVVVVAPSGEQSGAASALSLTRPLYPKTLESGFIAIDGTPSDCVFLALNQLYLDTDFDLVISGINSGANVGQEVLFSGTFGAAITAQYFGVPALAVSLAMHIQDGVGQDSADYYSISANEIKKLLCQNKLMAVIKDLPYHVLNVNIPDVAQLADINGYQITTLNERRLQDSVRSFIDPRERKAYWLSLKKHEAAPETADEISDHEAIAKGFISLTPVRLPQSLSQSREKLASVINSLSVND